MVAKSFILYLSDKDVVIAVELLNDTEGEIDPVLSSTTNGKQNVTPKHAQTRHSHLFHTSFAGCFYTKDIKVHLSWSILISVSYLKKGMVIGNGHLIWKFGLNNRY